MKHFVTAFGSLLLAASMGYADIQPAELVASSIGFNGNMITGNIYVGGTYGQRYPGGRVARLEAKTGNGPWTVLTSVTLPDMGGGSPSNFYLSSPYGNPVKVKTTFRLSISGSDRNNGNNVITRTYTPLLMADQIRITDTFRRSDALKKVKIFPK